MMYSVIHFIRDRFSGYAEALILLSSLLLFFSDSRVLKNNKLEREAAFSRIAGIVYMVIAGVSLVIGIFIPK
jgi:hypothetical protein